MDEKHRHQWLDLGRMEDGGWGVGGQRSNYNHTWLTCDAGRAECLNPSWRSVEAAQQKLRNMSYMVMMMHKTRRPGVTKQPTPWNTAGAQPKYGIIPTQGGKMAIQWLSR